MTPRKLPPAIFLTAALLCAPCAFAQDVDAPKPRPPVISAELLAAHPELKDAKLPPVYWTPPTRIYGQALSEQTLAAHPELMGVNLHGPIPGIKLTTMFAGTLSFRVGSEEGQDDIDVISKGITIVDPRWKKADRDGPKFEVQTPLRDAAGQNIGQLVLIYRTAAYKGDNIERDFYLSALKIRDEMARKIPAYADLFQPAPQ